MTRHWPCLVVTTLCCLLALVASAAAQTAEAGAVKQTLENYANAISARDLELLLSFIADDAQIDSRAAGKKVNKQEYREAMARALRNVDGVQLRNLKVTLTDADNAMVDGETHLRAGGQMIAAYRQWRLQKRDGKWLIVEIKDK